MSHAVFSPVAKMSPPLFSKKNGRYFGECGGGGNRVTDALRLYTLLALKKHVVVILRLRKERLNNSKYINLYIISTLFEPAPNDSMYLF